MKDYKINDVVKGKVRAIQKMQIIVDLESGMDGIIPITESLPVKIKKKQMLECRIIKIEDEAIILSMIINGETSHQRVERFRELGLTFTKR